MPYGLTNNDPAVRSAFGSSHLRRERAGRYSTTNGRFRVYKSPISRRWHWLVLKEPWIPRPNFDDFHTRRAALHAALLADMILRDPPTPPAPVVPDDWLTDDTEYRRLMNEVAHSLISPQVRERLR